MIYSTLHTLVFNTVVTWYDAHLPAPVPYSMPIQLPWPLLTCTGFFLTRDILETPKGCSQLLFSSALLSAYSAPANRVSKRGISLWLGKPFFLRQIRSIGAHEFIHACADTWFGIMPICRVRHFRQVVPAILVGKDLLGVLITHVNRLVLPVGGREIPGMIQYRPLPYPFQLAGILRKCAILRSAGV